MEDSRDASALGVGPVAELTDFDVQARNARLTGMVRVSGEPLLSLSTEGIIDAWNPAAERLYSYKTEEAIGLPFVSLFSPSCRFEEKALTARLRVGEVVTAETVHTTKDAVHLDVC